MFRASGIKHWNPILQSYYYTVTEWYEGNGWVAQFMFDAEKTHPNTPKILAALLNRYWR